MGRKFGGSRKSGGRREQREKTLKCLKCAKLVPLSEFTNHVKECKGNTNGEKPPT